MAKEMRQVYQETLRELMIADRNVVMLDADLASASGSVKTYLEFPKQSINCGISEANMISAACGMSLVGIKPYVHTFAPFATRRVFDQLYMSGSFSKNAIHIYASEPGIWAQFNGGTHTSFEDIALTRTLPNAVISAPSDEFVFRFILKSFYQDNKMYYTRSPRAALKRIYDEDTKFEIGKWMIHGEDLTNVIIAYGEMVDVALQIAEYQKDFGQKVAIVDAFNLYPYDKELLKRIARESKKIMVVENHSIYGGLGELVSRELLINKSNATFIHKGIEHQVSEVGTFGYLSEKFGIDLNNLVKLWNSQNR